MEDAAAGIVMTAWWRASWCVAVTMLMISGVMGDVCA